MFTLPPITPSLSEEDIKKCLIPLARQSGGLNPNTIAFALSQYRAQRVSLNLTARVCLANIGITDLEDPRAKAALAVAELATVKDNNPNYHNQAHTREVTIMTQLISNAEKLDSHQKFLLLIAALGHDVGHPGGPNHKPFEIETKSVQQIIPAITPYLSKADTVAIEQMILATDFRYAVPNHRAQYLDQKEQGKIDPRVQLTNILLDADIAASASLSLGYSKGLSALLSQEYGLPVMATPQGIKSFLTAKAKGTYVDNEGIQHQREVSIGRPITYGARKLGLDRQHDLLEARIELETPFNNTQVPFSSPQPEL